MESGFAPRRPDEAAADRGFCCLGDIRMPGRVTTVRGLLIAAALVPALAAAAGCGGVGSDGVAAPKGSGRSAAASSAAPGRALIGAELKRALVGSADPRGPLYEAHDAALPSGVGVSGPGKAACTPLVEQLALLTVVRTGEQTVTYQSFASFHHDPVLPKDIVTAQDKKLRAAAA
jgi:hypothetical protein